MTTKTIVSLAAIFLTCIGGALAQGVRVSGDQPRLCYTPSEVIVAPRGNAPPLVNMTLNRFPSLAFRLCTDRLGPHYFLRAPEPVSEGICSFFEKEVFPSATPPVPAPDDLRTAEGGVTWSNPPPPWRPDAPTAIKGKQPTHFMSAQNGGMCPSLDSLRYAPVHNVSAEGFRTLDTYWHSLASSETSFQAVVSRITECQRDIEWDAQFHKPDLAAKYAKRKIDAFHTFLFDSRQIVGASSITFEAGIYSVVVFRNDNNVVPFEAKVQVTPNGLELKNLCSVYVA